MPGDAKEKVREMARKAEEVAKRIGSAIEKGVEKLAEKDIPRFTRNAIILATGAMMLYIMGTAIASMLPAAKPVFTNMGIMLGYMVPLMFNAMIIATVIGIIRLLVK